VGDAGGAEVKFNLNVEVTDDELKEYAADVLLRSLGTVWRDLGGALANPQATAIAMNLFQQVASIQSGMRHPQQRQRGPVGPPAYPYGPGLGVPAAGYSPPGPYGTSAAPYGAPPGANGPDNVRPIRESAHVEQCFPIEETRNMEAGVGCCRCATFNNVQRTQCRSCGHVLCHHVHHGAPPIVTPPPRQSVDMTEQMIEQMKQLFQQITERPWPEPPEPAKPPQGA